MLSDTGYEYVKTTLNNWEAFGTPRLEKLARQHESALAEIREALKDGVASADEAAGRIGDKIPEDLRKGVALMREQAGPQPNELEKLKDQLDESHVEALKQVIEKHDLGLPKLSEPWNDEVVVAWMSHFNDMPEPMLGVLMGVKDWWNGVGDILD